MRGLRRNGSGADGENVKEGDEIAFGEDLLSGVEVDLDEEKVVLPHFMIDITNLFFDGVNIHVRLLLNRLNKIQLQYLRLRYLEL